MGLTFVIIGFEIWPKLPKMQSLNHAIITILSIALYHIKLW